MKNHITITLALADANGNAYSIETIALQLAALSPDQLHLIAQASFAAIELPEPVLDDFDTAKLDAVFFGKGGAK